MRLGIFHRKKKVILNKIKIYLSGFLFLYRKVVRPLPEKIEKIVVIHNNKKLGDLIVFSSIYRELKSRNIHLTIITDPRSALFLRENKKIDDIIIKDDDGFNSLWKLRKKMRGNHYDLLIDPFETLPNYRHAILLLSIKASHVLGFDKWYHRYYDTFDRHDENLQEHISTRVLSIMKYVDKNCNSLLCGRYDLPISSALEYKVDKFVNNQKIIILHAFGAKKICCLSNDQIHSVYNYIRIKFPDSRIIFTGLPEDLRRIDIDGAEFSPFKTFSETIALTKAAYLLVSVDTALIHVAAAFTIPTVAIYPKAKNPYYPSVLVWGPNNKKAVTVVSDGFFVNELPEQPIQQAIDKIIPVLKSPH
ncbi:lipopolysaccharide 1,2-N-acetylglucosaminetransferase [Salmonella enterica subsp. enterica serovar Choleraesuis]|nr:lipopolysaccharide 1,2-N-acetylglucosaminetransferase [Salmonella enterica subsp. enterica serovar Choleraesuis]